MKNSPSGPKGNNTATSTRKPPATVTPTARFKREHVVKVFREFGYQTDLATEEITVLRNTHFPFQRVTLPNHPAISVELLKLFARDAHLDFREFYRRLQALAPQAK